MIRTEQISSQISPGLRYKQDRAKAGLREFKKSPNVSINSTTSEAPTPIVSAPEILAVELKQKIMAALTAAELSDSQLGAFKLLLDGMTSASEALDALATFLTNVNLEQKNDRLVQKRKAILYDLRLIYENRLATIVELPINQLIDFEFQDSFGTEVRNFINTVLQQLKTKSKPEVFGVITVKPPLGGSRAYTLEGIRISNNGTTGLVHSSDRESNLPGEIEFHTHVIPSYIGKIDAGDLIAALEGPAWNDPAFVEKYAIKEKVMPHLRIFCIVSVTAKEVSFQFYLNDLNQMIINKGQVVSWGTNRLGEPLVAVIK